MIQPRNDYLLVTRYERPEESPGGIIIPESYREDRSGWLWEVVAVGPGTLSKKGIRKPCDSKPGDIVYSEHPYAAQDLQMKDDNGRDLYLVNEQQVALLRWRPDD